MIYDIRIMKQAQNDIREIYRYIAEDLQNPDAATRRIMLINEKIQSLKDNPARFPLVQDDYLASKGLRLIVIKTHLVFFIIRQKEQAVSVMRILYGRRDWLHLLRIQAALL